MLLNELLRSVSDKTAKSDESGSTDRAALVLAANEGVRQVLLDTRCMITKTTVSLTANVSEYTLSATILATVDYDGTTGDRNAITLSTATDVLSRRRTGSQGAARRFALIGHNLLIVNPTPTVAQDIYFYAVIQPATLVTGTNTDLDTIIPAHAQKAVEWWMCLEISQQNRDYQGIEYFTALYDKEIVKIRKRSRWRGGRRIGPPKIGYPDDPGMAPSDPSADWRD